MAGPVFVHLQDEWLLDLNSPNFWGQFDSLMAILLAETHYLREASVFQPTYIFELLFGKCGFSVIAVELPASSFCLVLWCSSMSLRHSENTFAAAVCKLLASLPDCQLLVSTLNVTSSESSHIASCADSWLRSLLGPSETWKSFGTVFGTHALWTLHLLTGGSVGGGGQRFYPHLCLECCELHSWYPAHQHIRVFPNDNKITVLGCRQIEKTKWNWWQSAWSIHEAIQVRATINIFGVSPHVPHAESIPRAIAT